MIRKHTNCRADICQLCPVCNRKREWIEWLIDLSKNRVEVQLRLSCPADCIGTSFYAVTEHAMEDWCNQCHTIRHERKKGGAK
jgi:hypothetical protein